VRARGRATRVHARPRGRTVTSPRGRTGASARTQFLPRPRVKLRPRVNVDARGRPDEKDVRMDIFIQKRPL
jgi:hypothetical protein